MNKEFLKKKLFLLTHAESLLRKRSEIQDLLHILLTTRSSEETMISVKKELLELDHSLDVLTDDDQINKESIIKEITEHLAMLNRTFSFPEQVNYDANKKAYQELSILEPYIIKYYESLKKGSLILLQGKKRSLLSILFGRHPKVLLSYEIISLAKEASKDFNILNELNFSYAQQCRSIHEMLLSVLKEIIDETNKRWNHSLYEEAFPLFFTKISKLKEELSLAIEENSRLFVKLQEEIIEKLYNHLTHEN